ncbi:hypothetical protein EUTSA_v10028277mg [Eutrema salsugineum]|uniref:F-box domain-containing protein n=1 Tax=Eutrema salsugineum TaxID=72664 RepID=V4LXB2_EUTSA|nr:hypothetical protein EUTSA_v10028277mg [Eutrema salsugineum]
MKQKNSAEAEKSNKIWSNLPFDLTLLIMQRMSLKDNIRASVVCKTWHKALVRVEDPWVICNSHFSCAPTSSTCVLLAVTDFTMTFISIKTYRPTTKKWMESSICLSKIGCLGMFDLYTKSWNVLFKPPPKLFEISDDQCFMTEYQGDIYIVYTHDPKRKPTFLRLET